MKYYSNLIIYNPFKAHRPVRSPQGGRSPPGGDRKQSTPLLPPLLTSLSPGHPACPTDKLPHFNLCSEPLTLPQLVSYPGCLLDEFFRGHHLLSFDRDFCAPRLATCGRLKSPWNENLTERCAGQTPEASGANFSKPRSSCSEGAVGRIGTPKLSQVNLTNSPRLNVSEEGSTCAACALWEGRERK